MARAAGAHEAVPVEGFRDAVKELTRAGSTSSSTRSAATGSPTRCAACARGAGCWWSASPRARSPTVKVNRLLLNNIDVVGVGWGAFALGRPGYAAGQWDELVPHLALGRARPAVGARFPLEQAAEALTQIDERRVTGKIVLQL